VFVVLSQLYKFDEQWDDRNSPGSHGNSRTQVSRTLESPVRIPFRAHIVFSLWLQQTGYRMGSSGILLRVALLGTEVSEELSAYIIG
jgi:hypothetical protein